MRGLVAIVALPAVALGLAVALAGCGEDRSPEAYCRAFYTTAAPIRQGYVDANENMEQDPLTAFVRVFSAPGDLASIFDSMVPHAPDEIQSDTAAVRDSFKKLQDTMGSAISDPLGAIGGSLVNSLTSAGSFERVDTYLADHCPPNSPLAQQIIRESQD